jgi:hypothetical protein
MPGWSIVQFAQAPTGGVVTLSPTASGNLIVVAVSNDGASAPPTSITLTGSSDVFTDDVSTLDTNPTANIDLSIWSNPNCSGGKTSVVASGGLGSGVLMSVWELAGGAASSPLRTAHAAAGPANTQQGAFDSGAASSVPAGDFWIAAVTGIGSGGVRAAASPSGAWTLEAALTPGSLTQMIAAYQSGPGAGAPQYAGTFTAPVGGAYWAAAVAAYKPAGPARDSGQLLGTSII